MARALAGDGTEATLVSGIRFGGVDSRGPCRCDARWRRSGSRASLTRCIAALDYWILFTVRLSRRPGPWIALHRLLSVPLLVEDGPAPVGARAGRGADTHALPCPLELGSADFSRRGRAENPRGGCRGSRSPDLEVVQVHPWTAPWWRRRGWLTVPAFVRYQGRARLGAARPPFEELARKPRPGPPQRLPPAAWRRRRLGARPGDGRVVGSSAVWLRCLVSPAARVEPDASPRSRDHDRRRRPGRGDGDRCFVGGGGEAWLGPHRHRGRRPRAAARGSPDRGVCCGGRGGSAQRSVDLRQRPLLARADDQIAAYKRRWGFRPTADPLSPLYALRARTPAGERFLAAQPLWALGPGGALRRVGSG